MAKDGKGLGKNPRESTKVKLREFADLWRGGPEGLRGKPGQCYLHMNPGVSKKGAEARASEWLNHPYTQEYIKAQTDKVAEEADVTQRRVVKELVRVGMYDFRKLFDDTGKPLAPQDLDEDTAAAIVGLKVTTVMGDEENPALTRYEYKLPEKTPALDKLMKHLGGYEKDNKQRAKSLAELIAEVRGAE